MQVTIGADHPTFFSHVLGFSNMRESTTATAQLVGSSNPITILLGNGTNNLTGELSAPGGSILTNGTFTCGSQTITAASIGYAGAAPSCTKAKFAQATPSPMVPIKNPCPEISGCNYLANNPPPTTNCQTLKGT